MYVDEVGWLANDMVWTVCDDFWKASVFFQMYH